MTHLFLPDSSFTSRFANIVAFGSGVHLQRGNSKPYSTIDQRALLVVLCVANEPTMMEHGK